VSRQRFKKAPRQEPEVPVASFSDIAFLLIIFFILVTTLVKTQGIVADVPSGQKNEAADTSKTPIIQLNDTAVTFNDERTTLEKLPQQLTGLDLQAKDPSERIIMLEASGEVPYQTYFEVLSMISSHGGVVAMVTEE